MNEPLVHGIKSFYCCAHNLVASCNTQIPYLPSIFIEIEERRRKKNKPKHANYTIIAFCQIIIYISIELNLMSDGDTIFAIWNTYKQIMK